MKKLLYFLTAIGPFLMYGQLSPTENYVYKVSYQTAVQDATLTELAETGQLQQVTYYDAAGRPKQSIAISAGGAQEEIVSHYEYDSTGRRSKSYLPLVVNPSNPFAYDATAGAAIPGFYNSRFPSDYPDAVKNPYSETRFENYPGGRPLEQGAPGSAWKVTADADTDRTVKLAYGTNASADVINFDVEFTAGDYLQPVLAFKGFYDKEQLYLTITKSENWVTADGKANTTETFIDKQGRTILVRTFNKIGGVATPHNQYYVYDDFGNLTFFFSPKASETFTVMPVGYTPFSQTVQATTLLNYTGLPPSGNAATIILTGTYGDQLSVVFDFTLGTSRWPKTGNIVLLNNPVPDTFLGTVTAGTYSFDVRILNGYLNISNIAGTLPSKSAKITTTLTATLLTDFTFAPLAAGLIDDLGYQYRYDSRNRPVEKKLPGKGWEKIVYDRADRPILSQDANQQASNKWLFVKYDIFGRVAYTGEWSTSSNRPYLQNLIDTGNHPLFEHRSGSFNAPGAMTISYSNQSFPVGVSTAIAASYYDAYGFIGATTPPSLVYAVPTLTGTALKGLPTGSMIRVLTSANKWEYTTIGYDKKARPIWSTATNAYLTTTDVTQIKNNFAGQPTETTATHTMTGIPALVTVDKYTYDHVGRMLRHTNKIGTDTEQLITFNSYDNLGQLLEKKVGGIDTTTTYAAAAALQTVNYSFNTRGWLTKINDPATGVGMSGDLFATEIKYHNPTIGGTPLHDGNISQVFWKSAGDAANLKNYNYTYDNLGRLKTAVFAKNNVITNTYNESLEYDKNGNITSLLRAGMLNDQTFDANLDILSYTYSGNKLTRVVDSGNRTQGFDDHLTILNSADHYGYDANGNIEYDLNKDILPGTGNATVITYNQFNLPLKITFNGTNRFIEYVYLGGVKKIAKIVTESTTVNTTQYAGNYIYTKGTSGSFVLNTIGQAEGYVAVNGVARQYVFQFKDHLGNARLSFRKVGASPLEIVEENAFYPFGMKHKDSSISQSTIVGGKFRFNGQESEEALGLNMTEMSFRQYDATVGRFFGIDMLAESEASLTPYHFAGNNPVMFADPSGLKKVVPADPPNAPPSYMSNWAASASDIHNEWFNFDWKNIRPSGGSSNNIYEMAMSFLADKSETQSLFTLYGADGSISAQGVAGLFTLSEFQGAYTNFFGADIAQASGVSSIAFGPSGKIILSGLTAEQLGNIRIIPEDAKNSTDLRIPTLNGTYSGDGFYQKGITVSDQRYWYKVSNGSSVKVEFNTEKGSFLYTRYIDSFYASIGGSGYYVGFLSAANPHWTTNPFID